MTRKMQKLNFAVMLFYYACIAFPTMLIGVLIDSLIRGEAIRFWSYDGTQYMFICLISIINMIGLSSATIAMQNERSGFITLVGYIGFVYAFFGDLLIF